MVWDTNMAAISLFWDTNMAAVTSCENTLLADDAHGNVWVASKVYYGRCANADLMVQQVWHRNGLHKARLDR